MNKTSIEWTDYTWNPVTGCTKVSQGCKHCYAETLTMRFGKVWGQEKFTQIQLHPHRLLDPANAEKKLRGRKIFVCDMSDLFHEQVPASFIMDVFETIHNCPDTVFQILTKRPARALEVIKAIPEKILLDVPFPNVWIGTSVEDQATADKRIPLLLQIPAAVRFLSCEPLLGPIDFYKHFPDDDHPLSEDIPPLDKYFPSIHWVIAGGESGHGARPMHPDWVRSLRDQCATAYVPFFFKQWGEYMPYDDVPDGEVFINKMHTIQPGQIMYKVGKSKSGNYLDGVQHLEFPSSTEASREGGHDFKNQNSKA